jgi:hypothetical protein
VLHCQCRAAGVAIHKNDKDTTNIVNSQMDVVFSNNIPGVSEIDTIILSGNKTCHVQPISLVTFWGKIALKRFKNQLKSSRN